MNSRIRFFKLLVLSLAIILCVGMLLVSCGDDTEGSGSADKPSDSTEKSPSTESSKDDSVPSATQSSVSGTTDSSKPGTVDTSNPGTTDSSKPGTTDSSNPGTDEPCDHNFVKTSSIPATCKEEGIDTYTCSECGSTKEEKVAKLTEHTYEYTEIQPTCQTEGKIIGVCEECGDTTETKGKPKTDHTGHEVILTNPTCTEKGSKDWVCKDCGTSVYKADFEKEIPALGHDWEVSGEQTCKTEGKTPYKCSRENCGETKLDGPVVGEIRHVYQETVIGATCISDAVYKCKECGNEYAPYDDDVEGKAHGEHVLVYSETVAPTCTSDGYKIYKCGLDKNCTVSGKNTDINNLDVPKPEDVVPAIEHQYDEPMADGLLVCYLCNKNYRDVTSEKASGNDEFCMGCGKDPCECSATSEWNGYTPAKEPEAIVANVEFTKKDVALTDSTAELEIGRGVIRIVGQEGATYTIKLYDEVDGILLDTLEFDGGEDAVYVILEDYDVVGMVQITSTTDALVSFYAQAK